MDKVFGQIYVSHGPGNVGIPSAGRGYFEGINIPLNMGFCVWHPFHEIWDVGAVNMGTVGGFLGSAVDTVE